MKNRVNEEQITEARSRNRQSKNPPWLIRDDGMLYPNVPLVAKKNNYRPYHGDPKASLAERLRYLSGQASRRKVTYTQVDEPFELGKATADEIVAFAMDEFGSVLDAETPIDKLRKQCYELSQLPELELQKVQQAGLEAAETADEQPQPTNRRRRSAAAEG